MRKVKELFLLIFMHPLEFYDRVMSSLERRLAQLYMRAPEYEIIMHMEEAAKGMERALRREMTHFLNEEALVEIENEVRCRIESIRSDAPFPLTHNADFTLARFCYLICRTLKPNIVLETGVAYGVTSAFILKALEVNEQGRLHSVDMPPLGREADRFVGALIPQGLKARWRLYRGASKRVLPRRLPSLGQVDMFVHDSLHTYRNMWREFQLVTPYLASQAAVVIDDIDGNSAFREWMQQVRPVFWTATKGIEKESLFGVSIKNDARSFGA